MQPSVARRTSASRHRSSQPNLGFIYAEKMSAQLQAALFDLGLASLSRDNIAYSHRPSMFRDGDPTRWIGVDERLASIYMCVLADEVSQVHALDPVTDQPLAHAAVGGWSVEVVASILLGTDFARPSPRLGAGTGQRTELVAQLALELVIPRDIQNVPVEALISFRRKHQAELQAFQEAVGLAVADLASLGGGLDGPMLNRYVQQVVEKRFKTPKDELEKTLRRMKFDTVLTTLSVRTSLPVLSGGTGVAAGLTVEPLVGVGVGVAVGLASIAAQSRQRKAVARKDAAALDYLLRLQHELRPAGVIKRSLAALPI